MGRFNNLPEDVMLEILTRLPTETALDCNLVCKSWRELVHLPSFSQMHLTRLNSADEDSSKYGFIILSHGLPPYFSYIEYDENCQQQTPFSREIEMDLNPPFQPCSFVGSCNGLICFSSYMIDKYGGYASGPTYISNPISREYISLPDCERKLVSLAGFGYVSSTNEYKVVWIDESREDSIVKVYTLGSGWRTVGNMGKKMEKVTGFTGAFANGALHWVDQAGTIFAFSLTDEKFSEIPSPPPCLTRAAVPYYSLLLQALGGFLGAICYYKVDYSEVWLLKKNKDDHDLSWSKELSFNSYISRPFGSTKSGMLLCYGNKKFFCYDSNASSAKMDVSFSKSISQAIPHKNTLVSLKAVGEKVTKIMEFGERLRHR